MTTPPLPDIGSMTLSPQRGRQNDSYEGADNRFHHFQTSPAVVPGPAQRRALPQAWLGEQESNAQLDSRPLSPPQTSDISSGGGSPPHVNNLHAQMPQPQPASQSAADDEVIPTAIVIKNIPFSVKKETLLDIIASLSIPTPYAFNYHLDPAGQFRGLAFANFRVAADADAVVAALNGFDVQGRKLRVEYKKVLQAGEKERIEREKAIRRMKSMQLEKEAQQQGLPHSATPSMGFPSPQPYDEGYTPLHAPLMSQSRSFSGALPMHQSHLGQMPVPQPFVHPTPPPLVSSMTVPNIPTTKTLGQTELDLNDPATLEIYSRVLLFKDDPMRDELAFARSLTPKQRRVVHLVAQKLGVYHYSVGEADERYAVVTRREPDRSNASPTGANAPPLERMGPVRHHSTQALSRSFLSPSASSNPFGSSASGSPSAFQSATAGSGLGGLRSKKSMPDMKSLYTPAPKLAPRASNGNIRDAYHTFSSPIRRAPSGPPVSQIFGSSANRDSIPPVPELSLTGQPLEGSISGTTTPGGGNGAAGAGVVRQPRGPAAAGGFLRRRESAIGPSNETRSIPAPSSGLNTQTHEPLEI